MLGDNHGESCAAGLVECAERWLAAQGLRVQRNQPYAGGFITEHYGDPAAALHALQIEVNRALYMDEREYRKSPHFDAVRADLGRMVARLASVTAKGIEPLRDAAE